MVKSLVNVIGMLAVASVTAAHAQTPGAVVFDSVPAPLPPNVASLGFQCCAIAELGDEIALDADVARRAGSATILMSSWALHSTYPELPSGGFAHPITLNVYEDAAAAQAHTPAKSITQVFAIPWRPEADPSCPAGGWRSAVDGDCYNGLAFEIEFDLRSLNYDLPSQFIYGVEFNTSSAGYQPIGVTGPYDSLNVGFSTLPGPTVGADLDPDAFYYAQNGSRPFEKESGLTGLLIGARFTTVAAPLSTEDCKNDGWRNLIGADGDVFRNQGECVSYVNAQQ